MSIFWLDGPKEVVSDAKIKKEMFEDRIFLPGIIHGGKDYLIRVYINDVGYEDEPDEFIAEYLTKDLILKAHVEDPSHESIFNEILVEEAENFACHNDGSGEFATLVEAWPEAIVMSNDDLVNWAKDRYVPKNAVISEENVTRVLEDKIYDTYAFFQEANGITSGDIMPMDAFAQDDLTEQLSKLITSVLQMELEMKEAEDSEDEDENDSDDVVWVYHEYIENEPYGNQKIKVFRKKEDGEKYLRERVETEYESPWEEIPEELKSPHWVSLYVGDDYIFFCLEKEKVNG